MQKINNLVAGGPPTAVAPCHVTIGTMGNSALGRPIRPLRFTAAVGVWCAGLISYARIPGSTLIRCEVPTFAGL